MNDMVMSRLSCCGIQEISSLGGYRTPVAAIRALAHTFSSYNLPAYVVFSGVVRRGGYQDGEQRDYAGEFAAYIRKRRLGMVTELPPRVNRNSGNTIQAYLWAPNRNLKKKVF